MKNTTEVSCFITLTTDDGMKEYEFKITAELQKGYIKEAEDKEFTKSDRLLINDKQI